MSRAFIKEDAQQDDVIVPPRAALPEGTPNLVTPRGLKLLERERGELLAEREAERDAPERLALLEARLDALQERLRSAEVVAPDPDADRVSFGVPFRVRYLAGPQAGQERRFTLVGVDEAALQEGLIPFTAPLAQAVSGHAVGERVRLEVGRTVQELEIVSLG
jgi:transcription elongation factor GreB